MNGNFALHGVSNKCRPLPSVPRLRRQNRQRTGRRPIVPGTRKLARPRTTAASSTARKWRTARRCIRSRTPAASRTLPLGTRATVTNPGNGKSAEIEIRDRGPYVDGRIVDVAPKIADKLGFREQGIALVEVRPIELPPKYGRNAVSARKDKP
ncbi:MAG: septal ring lytic transglycosylase RlpA family protein [Noviherbaspirillum sp.]